jgi:hypothetical protein
MVLKNFWNIRVTKLKTYTVWWRGQQGKRGLRACLWAPSSQTTSGSEWRVSASDWASHPSPSSGEEIRRDLEVISAQGRRHYTSLKNQPLPLN